MTTTCQCVARTLVILLPSPTLQAVRRHTTNEGRLDDARSYGGIADGRAFLADALALQQSSGVSGEIRGGRCTAGAATCTASTETRMSGTEANAV